MNRQITPVVSVVIPTKNDIEHIDKCLSSLMPYYNASYINEIIIIDGHSTDGTLDVLKKYPVKLVFEKVKSNVNIAFDYGWRQAKGDLIIIMNSDVYIGEHFFPRALEFFADKKVGWVSCRERTQGNNAFVKAQAQSWSASPPASSSSQSVIRGLYNRIASGGRAKPLYGGPCMITRRSCLEAINGLIGLTLGTVLACGDISFSSRVANKGWHTLWWLDAPVYHNAKPTFQGISKQFYDYGKSYAYMQLEKEFKNNYSGYGKVVSILSRLASPVIGVYMAMRFLNPMQLYVYPLPRFHWVWGYLRGWIAAKKTNQIVYSEPGILPKVQ